MDIPSEKDRAEMSDRVADLATAIVDVTANHLSSDVLLALCFVLAEVELQTDEPNATRIVSHVQALVPALLAIMQRIQKDEPDSHPGQLFNKLVKH